MKRTSDLLRNTLYKTFDLPADEYSSKLYNDILQQREKAEKRILLQSGIQVKTESILNNIRSRVQTTVIPLIHKTTGRLRRSIRIITTTAAAAALTFVLLMPGDTHKPDYLQITAWRGNPRIVYETKSIPLAAGKMLGEGTVIETGRNDRIALRKNGTRLALTENSKIRIYKLRIKKKMIAELGLKNGTAVFALPKGEYSKFHIRTPLGSVTVTGTVFSVDVQKSQLRIAVTRGSVVYRDSRSKTVQKLPAGHGLTLKEKRLSIVSLKTSTEFRDLQQLIRRTKSKSGKKKDETNKIRKHEYPPKPNRIRHSRANVNTQTGVRTAVRKRANSFKFSSYSGSTVRIHLKNGSIVRGKVIHVDSNKIRVRTSYSTMHINRQQITKINKVK